MCFKCLQTNHEHKDPKEFADLNECLVSIYYTAKNSLDSN